MKEFVLVAISLFMITDKTWAAGQWCSGKILNTYLSSDGQLVIIGSWRNQHTTICNINKDRYGVTPEVCKGWLALAITAKTTESNVVMHYADISSCADIPAYSAAPRPSYLMLNNQ